MLIPEIKPLEIPGIDKIYAGSDGELYRLKTKRSHNLFLDKIAIHYNSYCLPERQREKRVNLYLRSIDGDVVQIKFSVGYLICGAWKGWYKHLNKVVYLDKNRSNTKPDNLVWTAESFEKSRNIFEKIKEGTYFNE